MLRDRYFKHGCVLVYLLVQAYILLPFYPGEIIKFFIALLVLAIAARIVVVASVRIIARIRSYRLFENIIIKTGLTVLCTSSFSLVVSIITLGICQFVLAEDVTWELFTRFAGGTLGIVVCYTLIYEILFLNKERELDVKVVDQLQNELTSAEVSFLKNELDPHFVYNSLMPLYYLIKNDVSQAEHFTNKLMQVYQHFLQNRKKDFIALEEELQFLKNYFYLLEIRFNHSLKLKIDIGHTDGQYQIIPFTLQLLIENAIKHNCFNAENPLEVWVEVKERWLIVSNRVEKTTEDHLSTKIGIRNLRMRYRLLMNRNIYVYNQRNQFVVKVPLHQKTKQHDVSSNTRG